MKKFLGATAGVFLFSYFINTKISPQDESMLNSERAALCILNPDNSNTRGLVLFKQESLFSPTVITAKVSGLKSNAKHGFHIHEFGDLSEGCKTAGAHYNPGNNSHGGPGISQRHVGDLGNLQSDAEGNATFNYIDNLITLVGKNNIIGRSCVVHADEDDLGKGNFSDSKTTGHAGCRVACGVIALCSLNKKI